MNPITLINKHRKNRAIIPGTFTTTVSYVGFKVVAEADSILTIDWGDGTALEDFVMTGGYDECIRNYGTASTRIINFSGNAINSMTTLETVFSPSISSINISNIPTLQRLSIHNNADLTALDVSNNTELTYLSCGYTNISKLDVSSNTKLTYLSCSSTNISKLDVSTLILLETLHVIHSNLLELDVSNCPNLVVFYCSLNNLSELDVSNCPGLVWFHCDNNNLSAIDVSVHTALAGFYCNNNNLTTLDISANINLWTLYANNNYVLTELDVTNNIKLHDLRVGWNSLTSTTVNSHLALLVSTGVSRSNYPSGSILYNSQVQTPIAPPTGQGVSDAATLVSRGWTVMTD